jgi:hypothetical protein
MKKPREMSDPGISYHISGTSLLTRYALTAWIQSMQLIYFNPTGSLKAVDEIVQGYPVGPLLRRALNLEVTAPDREVNWKANEIGVNRDDLWQVLNGWRVLTLKEAKAYRQHSDIHEVFWVLLTQVAVLQNRRLNSS